jgi:uncharacterized damage-inducible protein DinB
MTQKDILLEQLEACHEKNGWFVAMSSALKNLTAAQAAAAGPEKGAHSIWEIFYHVVFWNERYLLRYKGQVTPEPKDNDSTFMPEGGTLGESEWSVLNGRFDSVMEGWKTAIRESEAKKLAAPIKKDSSVSWYAALSHMMIHTAYHIGQIVTLRKLQGSWEPAQGVN